MKVQLALNEMAAPVELLLVPLRLTDQVVPRGRPVSVKTNVIVATDTVTPTETGAPCTVTEPVSGVTMTSCVLFRTVYEYVPLGSRKVIELPVETWNVPASVTAQFVPDGSPLSVNVTAYVVAADAVNVIDFDTAAPFTVTLPELGLALYPETAPTVYVYVPFASLNVTVDVVELDVEPPSVTDQLVPDGSPPSVNVTP